MPGRKEVSIRRGSGGWGSTAGVTLVETMVTSAVLSVAVLGMVGTFSLVQRGLQTTKEKTLANNLAQEKIEALKDISYYRLLVTTATASDDNFVPAMVYDVGPNGVETINAGGVDFERRVHIRKVSETASGDLTYQSWSAADTGLKEILVSVVWRTGSEWRRLELRNLRDNPARQDLAASISGTVTQSGTGTPIENVTVIATQHTSRFDTTDSAGNYSFTIEPGSYTLRASKPGYFIKYSAALHASAEASPVGADFSLVKMASGSISGTAYLRDHLVISQVVCQTTTVTGDSLTRDVEYFELFNPTDGAIDIGSGGVPAYRFSYDNESAGDVNDSAFGFTYLSTYVPSGRYYLIANTTFFMVAGQWLHADAYYGSSLPAPLTDHLIHHEAGALTIQRASDDAIIDRVGWADDDHGQGSVPSEGDIFPDPAGADGLGDGNQIVRFSSPTLASDTLGKAYDAHDNATDFAGPPTLSGIVHRPRSTNEPAQLTVSGTPAAGAIAVAQDGLSTRATADSSGRFTIVSVATGTWTVVVSSGPLTQNAGLYGGASDGFSSAIPGEIYLTSAAATGYISGRVTTVTGAALPNILVEAGGGADRTDASGNYTLVSSTGTAVLVTANPNDDNPLYVRAEANASLTAGEMARADFSLSQGGEIMGVITSNGVDPIPNVPVTASHGGVERGTGISGSDGVFTISNLSTGTYTVEPQLEAREASSPASATVTVTGGGSAAAGTFTISGSLGYISGSLTLGGPAGTAIQTGVIIYATTSTIASVPPAISSATRAGSTIYYAGTSLADGTYRLGVRGGSSYNVYAWYTTWNGDLPTVTRKSHLNVSVPAGTTVDRDFSW